MGDGLFGKFKMLIGVEDVEEEEEEVVEAAAPAQPVPVAVGESRRAPSYGGERPPVKPAGYDRGNTFVQPKMEHRDSKVVSMQSAGSAKKQHFKMVVTEPKSFDECPKLVDNLKSKKPVIINLEKLENEKARKIFDFLSGATYALEGNVQKVSNNIFVFAPDNVDVLSTALEASGEDSSSFGSPWRR